MKRILCFLFGHKYIQSYYTSISSYIVVKTSHYYKCKRCNCTKVVIDRYDPDQGQFLYSETIEREV